MATNPNRPKFVTAKKAREWQPYVDQQIRRQMHKDVPQEDAVEHALDLRDERIRKGNKPPKFGKR